MSDDIEQVDDFEDEDDSCGSEFGGELCFLPAGHEGDHVNRPCNATCDTCNCVEWTDEEAEL